MNPHAELVARRIAAELLTDGDGRKGCRLAIMHRGEEQPGRVPPLELPGGGWAEEPIVRIIAEKLSESFDAAEQMALGIEQYAALQRYRAALQAAAKGGGS